MPPSDNSDGNADQESDNESRGNNGQNKMLRKSSKSAMWTTSPVKSIGPKPAYLSSKESVKKKGLLALISDRLDQQIKQYCFEKRSFYSTIMLLCTLLISLLFSLLCQLLEIINTLRKQLLPSSLLLHMYSLSAWLVEKLVRIMVFLKQKICSVLAFVTRKRGQTTSRVKSECSGQGRRAIQQQLQ